MRTLVAAAVVIGLGVSTSAAQIYNADTFDPWPFPADLDRDLEVGITDFLALLAAWGPCPAPCPPSCSGDLDDDCNVGITDFLELLASGKVAVGGLPARLTYLIGHPQTRLPSGVE